MNFIIKAIKQSVIIGLLPLFLGLNTSNSQINTTTTIKSSFINKENKDLKRVESIQKQISKIKSDLIDKTVRIGNNTTSSGVIISKDGYILTAGHVIRNVGAKIPVRLNNGKTYTAICLGKDVNFDYGLLKIESTDSFPFAKFGKPLELAKDEACLMLGHPKPTRFEKERNPILRIGFYKGINNEDYLKTSCIMMPGDSGGPLFDLNGNVIGICSYINNDITENYYPSIVNVIKNWDKLVNSETFNNDKKKKKRSIKIIEAIQKEKPFVLKGGKKTLNRVFSNNTKEIQKSVVKIESLLEDKIRNTRGSVFNIDGYIVAKSSDIGNNEIYCTFYDDIKMKAVIIGRDLENDLIVLKTNRKKRNLSHLNIENYNNYNVGQLLTTITSDGKTKELSGILGLGISEVKNTSFGYLGILFDRVNPSIIENTTEGMAAMKAGLLAGDQIIKMDTFHIKDTRDAINMLATTIPNQKITVTILREKIEKKLSVILGHKPVRNSYNKHIADAINVNQKKDGFLNVFTHDMPLDIVDCGTPVVDIEGKVIGINIARRNRTCSFAIPINVVKNTVNEILKPRN